MKLALSYHEVAAVTAALPIETDGIITNVVFDSRRITNGENSSFVALHGEFRDGHDFVQDAYLNGVRAFLVDQAVNLPENATIFRVENTLKALQDLAAHHRQKFDIPVIAITGSTGKTITKEYLGQLLAIKYKVTRSPKSYNSQFGVALSLLEITPETEIAIIEAGISKRGEMEKLRRMIQPTHGIYTNVGKAHQENFSSQEELRDEKLKLFENIDGVLTADSDLVAFNCELVRTNHYPFLAQVQMSAALIEDLALAVEMAIRLGVMESDIRKEIVSVQPLAMRMETFEGMHNSLIINDTYNLDPEALRASLQHQLIVANGRKRILIAGTSDSREEKLISEITAEFQPLTIFHPTNPAIAVDDIKDAVVLIKGSRKQGMERYAQLYRKYKHETFLEINLSAIRRNILKMKECVPSGTHLLAMVKAASYGSGAEKLATFLERCGISYLGVAYPEEGVELRKAGIELPILVMNADESSYRACILHNLEPAIFSVQRLDLFIRELISLQKINYPIHVKLETGMNRLGFNEDELSKLIDVLQVQPEVKVQSIYSHLATSDDASSTFVHEQAQKFDRISKLLMASLNYPVIRHLLNSDGILHFSEYAFDMVRMGIGMYGYASDKSASLEAAISWKSTVSAVRTVKAGEGIGYGQRGSLAADGQIATIPIGYADGFRRILGNGNSEVYIQGRACKVVGNVCMDMIMVDLNGCAAKPGEEVEIIGPNKPIEKLAAQMGTISYEVLTGISERVSRVYLEE